eukprot:gene9807-2000_t
MNNISPNVSLLSSPRRTRPTPNLNNSSYVLKSVKNANLICNHTQTVLTIPISSQILPKGLNFEAGTSNNKIYFIYDNSKPVFVVKIASEVEKTILELLRPHPHCIPCRLYPFPTNALTHRHWAVQMPFYQQTLKQYYMCESDHTLEEDRIWSVLLDMALALQHLKRHGIVHKDIKCENIFCGSRLLPDGKVDPIEPVECVLGDFGVASAAVAQSDAMRTGGGDGDGIIMAPEAIHAPSHKSDMFSLGLTVAELRSDYYLPVGGSEPYHSLRQDDLLRFPSLQRLLRQRLWRKISAKSILLKAATRCHDNVNDMALLFNFTKFLAFHAILFADIILIELDDSIMSISPNSSRMSLRRFSLFEPDDDVMEMDASSLFSEEPQTSSDESDVDFDHAYFPRQSPQYQMGSHRLSPVLGQRRR